MKVLYDPKIKKKDVSERELVRAYGSEGAKKIRLRVNQLMACRSLAEALNTHLGRCHELKGDLKGLFSFDVVHPCRLLIRPKPPVPMREDGGIDLGKVEEVIIVNLCVDTHK